MALAFNVSNLGPLSQVSFDFKDVGAVVYFAYTHSGWFNSSDRALSLEQTLASSGVSLAAVFTFDRDKYEASRKQHSKTWGVARNLSSLSSSHNWSTLSCGQRANTHHNQTRSNITDLSFRAGRVDFAIEGPYLSALIRYVQSVATEEGADDYQNRILNDIDVQIQRVTCAALADLQASKHTEIGQIIGLLDWLLTPPSQDKSYIYTTRSLRVWCLAMALSGVGFDLEADHTAITTPFSEASSRVRNESYTAKDRVILVLAPGWETDQGGILGRQKLDMLNIPIKRPPRAIPVRAFPAIAYTDIAPYLPQCVSSATLETAFIGTYIFVRHKLSCDEKFRLAARLPAPFKIDQRKYATLLNSTGEGEDIDMDSLLSEIGFTTSGSLKRNEFLMPVVKPLVCRYLSKMKKDEDIKLMGSCIQWAFVLASISLFVCNPDSIIDESGLDMHFMYTKPIFMGSGEGTDSLWKCFLATVQFLGYIGLDQYSQKIHPEFWRLPDSSSSSSGSTISWSALVMKVILGIDKEELKPEPSSSDATYWGAQKDGLVLQSDFIVNPTARFSAAYLFHLTRGHLLDIPTEKGRIVEGETTTPYLRYHHHTPLSDRDKIEQALLADQPKYIDTLRIDLEPCWESDENKSRFVLRAGGIPKLQLGMSSLFNSAHVSTRTDLITRVQCSGESSTCPGPESILELMLCHPRDTCRWALLPLQSMIEQGQVGLPTYHSSNIATAENWIAKAYDSEVLVMLALNCKYEEYVDGRHKIITNCLGAGLMKAISIGRRSAMIILSNETHNRLLEGRASTYSKREDLLRTAACIIWNTLELRHMDFHYKFLPIVQVVRLIWQHTDNSTTTYWADAIVKRLVYYKEHKGITEVGILAVLMALEIPDFKEAAQDFRKNENTSTQSVEYFKNREAMTQKVEELIQEWQRKNMSQAELAALAEAIAREETDIEEIERLDSPELERTVLSNDYTEHGESGSDEIKIEADARERQGEIVVDISRPITTHQG